MRRVNTLIGSPIERVEDLRFVQGRGQFVDDLNRPGQWHAAIVRSPFAHDRGNSCDDDGSHRYDLWLMVA